MKRICGHGWDRQRIWIEDSCQRSLRLGGAVRPSRRIAELQAIRHPPHMAAFAAFTSPCGEGENAFSSSSDVFFAGEVGGGALTMDLDSGLLQQSVG